MREASNGVIGVLSKFILNIPFLEEYLDGARGVALYRCLFKRKLTAVAGWGKKKNTKPVRYYAKKYNIPYWSLEDGFLRSYGTGRYFPHLALVLDRTGIYYDSTCPSDLELLLESPKDLLCGIQDQVLHSIDLIKKNKLSKYNHQPDFNEKLLRKGRPRVLVIDQTFGDFSVLLGSANSDTFIAMLEAARRENPTATVYVKTHPEVSSKYKKGYLSWVREDEQTVILNKEINPIGLIEHMDKVYVVTSQLGFEALLCGKPVVVFGLPWYAGWGCTEDRQQCLRRTKKRTVTELFAAGYWHYSRYLNPYTHKRGTIFDVIDWIIKQKNMVQRLGCLDEQLFGVGFNARQKKYINHFLSFDLTHMRRLNSQWSARKMEFESNQTVVCWNSLPNKTQSRVEKSKNRVLRMEDGFFDSGSNWNAPLSLVMDTQGIYFDPRHPSDLETLLNQASFSDELLHRAQRIRQYIVDHKISKNDVETIIPLNWTNQSQTIILIPGQADDDASIRFGCSEIKSNVELVQVVRMNYPDAFIVYKPYSNGLSAQRKVKNNASTIKNYVDHIETRASLILCIEAADEVHTMTSLSGFDALLRGKKVVTYGEPFYAGWGLTEDKIQNGKSFARRHKRLSLDELVAGVLLEYPIYYDWELRGYTSCEAVLNKKRSLKKKILSTGHKIIEPI